MKKEVKGVTPIVVLTVIALIVWLGLAANQADPLNPDAGTKIPEVSIGLWCLMGALLVLILMLGRK